MRKPVIAGNWKMNKTINEAIELVNSLKRELVDVQEADIIVCPVYTALSEVSDLLIDSNIFLGAQNVYWEASGAFTGEISPLMLKDAGCSHVIIGHSERRKYFNETDEAVNKRIKATQASGLIPIFCVGETLEEREENKTIEVIEKQLKGGLEGFESEALLKLIIAYEPVWAIGTGKTATPQQAQEVHKSIRGWLKEHYSSETAENLRILYGGSVKPANIRELMQQGDIDGALVGGAALDSSSFVEIVKNSLG
ncbi:MAG: triose-phosphate isomerase [Candidatus Omnitrophica bacterium]|nr:triose-phosphate isomerase [Candidatus Omnitrophota bacterium]